MYPKGYRKITDTMPLNETATILYIKYDSLTLNTRQLSEVLHYTNPRALTNAISAQRCPVRTFRIGGSRVADIRDVADYLDKARGQVTPST